MWEMLKDGVFSVLQVFSNVLGDWGLAIIVITIIFRALITPLMLTQAKSSYQMNKMQPLIKEIQAKYADDPVRQQEETQRMYAEAKFNPLAGCVPMLIQMPIFILLFQVLRELGERVDGVYSFYNLVPSLTQTPGGAFGNGFAAFVPYLILMVVFAGATFVPMLLQQRNSTDAQQKRTMYMMSFFMSIMMLWISWTSPAGVLLFWGVSSILAIGQQQWGMHLAKKDEAKAAAERPVNVEPVKVDVVRKEKKKRPTKKR